MHHNYNNISRASDHDQKPELTWHAAGQHVPLTCTEVNTGPDGNEALRLAHARGPRDRTWEWPGRDHCTIY